MLSIKRMFCGVTVVVLSALVFAAGLARGQDAAPAAAKGPPVQIGVVAIKSFDAAAAFAMEIGAPLPPQWSPQGIEQQVPFIGQGNLVTDKPIGIVLFGGANFNPQQMMAIMVPVKPGAASADAMTKAGGMPVAGHDGMFARNGVNVTHTGDYLVVSPEPALAAMAKPGVLAAALKGPDNLVRIVVDVKAIRTSIPDHINAFLTHIGEQAANTPAGQQGAQLVIPQLKKELDALDRLEIALDDGAKGIRLAFTAAPSKMPAPTAGNRAGMPPGVFARFDLNVSLAKANPEAGRAIVNASVSALSNAAKVPFTAERQKRVTDFFSKEVDLAFNPAATSIGIEMIGADPVIYVVQHWDKSPDCAMELRQVVSESNAVAEAKDDVIELQTYKSGAMKVMRAVANEHGKTIGYLDMVQRDNDVFIAISPTQFRYVDKLIAAPSKGPSRGLASGYLDLGKLLDAVGQMPNSPLAGMPPDVQKQLKEILAGQRLTVSATTEGDAETVDIGISKGLVQNAPKLMALIGGMAGGPGGPPGAGPGAGPTDGRAPSPPPGEVGK
ncbi:MAG TPA: hypothetical protein VFC78_16515 [Tepidisphaeraceae bacterium]|nr:hypothetical protein [Tepidisphaeraceae bacterium]